MLVSPVSPIARPRERPLVNLSMQQKSVMLKLPGVYDAIFLPARQHQPKDRKSRWMLLGHGITFQSDGNDQQGWTFCRMLHCTEGTSAITIVARHAWIQYSLSRFWFFVRCMRLCESTTRHLGIVNQISWIGYRECTLPAYAQNMIRWMISRQGKLLMLATYLAT